MKFLSFGKRNAKEILRDKLNLFFGIGFPIVLLLLLSMIQANIPVQLFTIEKLAPGVAIFGLSFITLFSAVIISKDRTSSFMLRLFTSPMTAADFIAGYTLPMLPISLMQTVICYLMALPLGLELNAKILLAIAVSIPASVLFIALGLLFGSILNDKQVGGICGALLTNLSAWLSGTWFDISLVGGGFEAAAKALPFCHAVDAGRFALSGDYEKILPELLWVCGYAVVVLVLSLLVFTRKMSSDNQ